MFKAYSKLIKDKSDFKDSIIELQHDTHKALVIAVVVLALIGHFIVGILQPGNLILVWGITLFIVVFGWISLVLSKERIQVAQVIWLISLLLYLLLVIYLLKTPEFAYLFALLPFIAVISLGPVGGIAMEVSVTLLTILLFRAPIAPSFREVNDIVIVIGGLITGIIGWVAGNTLITVADWSLYGMEQARKNMEEARSHRGQMTALLKDLDLAYYRLERANSTLIAAYKQVDQAEQFKGEFITRVSHEMRTPLNLIAGYSELILSSPENYGGVELPGPYRGDINSIYTSSQHLLSVVDDILDLARVEVGKLVLTREWVDLSALIQEAADMMRDYLSAKKLELQIHIDGNIKQVLIDRLRIRQVLLNLLVNAARFTDRGIIRIMTQSNEKEVIVRVTDTGRGIAAEIIPKIFDEFRTTAEPGSAWHTGSGLGLPISKRFIELHKGKMGVESALMQGSTFWFSLPYTEINPLQETIEPTAETRYLDSMRKLISPVKNDYAIVLIAEDPRTVSTLKHYLGEYNIIHAHDYKEGFAKAQESKAIALVVNIHEDIPSPPGDLLVIRCPLPDYQKDARAIGAIDFLMKPVSPQQLIKSIQGVGGSVERILVVDDDLETVKLFQRMLYTYLREGNCLDAYNGLEALQVLRTTRVDLVLLDISMPEMDGYQVLYEMKSDPSLASIPVILLSGLVQDNTGQLEGMVQIEKQGGFNLGQVVQTVEAVLSVLVPSWRLPASTVSTPEVELVE